MGSITILPETTQNPITLIGKRAGICWNADISDDVKNYERGLDCITSNHGRTFEFVNIEMVIDGYSARVIREWYTHIGGAPTRLQASTRYIDYTKNGGFDYVIPKAIQNHPTALVRYQTLMKRVNQVCVEMEKEFSIPREDSAMCLPLSMSTKIVDKRNLRNLVDMSRQRECTRAYWEFRQMFNEVKNALSEISDEWKVVMDKLFKPKCEELGYCPEKKSCGRKDKLK